MNSTDSTNQEKSQTPSTKRHGSGRPPGEHEAWVDQVMKEMVENLNKASQKK